MTMEYSTGQFHVLNAWNQPAQYSRLVWTSTIYLTSISKNYDKELLKIIWLQQCIQKKSTSLTIDQKVRCIYYLGNKISTRTNLRRACTNLLALYSKIENLFSICIQLMLFQYLSHFGQLRYLPIWVKGTVVIN